MSFETVGYAQIKKQTSSGSGADDYKPFEGQACRVMEFDREGGALVLNPEGTALAMFDKCDIQSRFECCVNADVLMPPELKNNIIGQMAYNVKVMTRKGGYNLLLKQMVIHASLHYGKFNDNVLWQKQNEAERRIE